MSAEDALALFQSLGVARVQTTDAGEVDSQDDSEKTAKRTEAQDDEVIFDMEISATEEAETSAENPLKRGFSCLACDYKTPHSGSLKRHLLVKHGILGDVTIKRCDISASTVKDKSEGGSIPSKAAKVADRSKDLDTSKPYEADEDESGRPAFGDHVQFKASRAREPPGTLISLSSSKFLDTSIELIESESESVLKMPVSALASLNEKDALELLKSLRQATKLHTPQAVCEIDLGDPGDPAGSNHSQDSEPEAPPSPGPSKSGNSEGCEICHYSSPYGTSMRRHMLVKHGLVQDISNAPKRASKKRSAENSEGKSKKTLNRPKIKPRPKKASEDKPTILVMERKIVRSKK